MYKATVIISIYRDVDALKLILQALETQTESNFEIIVSEDGESEAVASYIDPITSENRFQHITQQDIGFRKNRALNRAILAARSDILIFIDGDCIPHPGFIEAHLRSTSLGFAWNLGQASLRKFATNNFLPGRLITSLDIYVK